MRVRAGVDDDCAIAQAVGVVGDWWTLLIVRDVAGGITRFDALQAELQVSRKVLTERLAFLVDAGVLERRPYTEHPPRYDYLLTAAGRGLLPTLVALQDWGTRFVMGDGTVTAGGSEASLEAHRMRRLVGTRLPVVQLDDQHGAASDLLDQGGWSVVYCFPGGYPPRSPAAPAGWAAIPGAAGCTLESATFREHAHAFTAAGASVRGVSSQRPDELDAFARSAGLPFPLLSDEDNALAAALRLPTFRVAGTLRLKRLTLVVDPDRIVRAVHYPITDPAQSVLDALAVVTDLGHADRSA